MLPDFGEAARPLQGQVLFRMLKSFWAAEKTSCRVQVDTKIRLGLTGPSVCGQPSCHHVTISVYKHINKLTGQLAKCSRSCLFGGCLGIIMWIRKLWVFVSSFPYFRPPTFLCVFRSLRYVPVSRCSHNAGIRGCKVFRGNTTRIMRCGDFSGNRRLDLVFP